MMTKHIYVHIPFCDSICFYCDFFRSVSNETIKKQWLSQITKEIQAKSFSKISTLYFGGGTPSCLSVEAFEQLATLFAPYLAQDYEWTIEVNPDSVTKEKLQIYKKWGVNRISMGVQTFHDVLLKKIGRKHTSSQVYQAIDLCHEVGINNVSLDLIYALPGETLADLKADLDAFLNCKVDHISIYSLQIEANSVFGKQHLQPCDSDLEADMYECIEKTLTAAGYTHYEISSYAKNNRFSKHNCSYWDDSDFMGIGCGASGREKGICYDIDANLQAYCQNGPKLHWVPTNAREQAFEAIMMALRTCFGLDIKAWNKKYQRNFLADYAPVLEKYTNELVYKENRVFCTPHGFEILNSILVDFLDEN